MQINFNISTVSPYSGTVSILPAGEYPVEIVSEKEEQLRSGNGTALVFEYQVRDGQFRGQRLREWLNLNHSSEGARLVAQRRLKGIADAVGVPNPRDTRDLFNRPFLLEVAVSVFNGKERNDFIGYKPSVPSQASAPSGNGGAYWN